MSFKVKFNELASSKILTNNLLTTISRKCGIQTPFSRKTELIQSITNTISTPSLISSHNYNERPFNLLAIDMGLKNFSFCRFQLTGLHTDIKPKVTQWFKMDLNRFTNIQENSFEPENYSTIIDDLIMKLIYGEYNPHPDLIIVERQRFRTQGNKNVLESILKTNVLEFSLFSALRSFERLDPKNYKAVIRSVSPMAMGNYWSGYYNERRPTELDSKDLRIGLVHDWMMQLYSLDGSKGSFVPEFEIDSKFDLMKVADDMQRLKRLKATSRRLYEMVRYLNEIDASPQKISVDETDCIRKGDDVADSLLHGLAVVHYELNRLKLIGCVVNQQDLIENLF